MKFGAQSQIIRRMIAARPALAFMGAALFVLGVGCTAFNPAFLALFSSEGGQPSFVTLPNAPGHVVLAVVNNAEIDERLVSFLGPQLNLSEAEIRALRPRMRFRMRITYIDGTFETVEFVTGTRDFIDPDFSAEAFTDLNQNDLDNVVAQCDVASVQIEPGTNIEVFLPVELTQFELVEITNPSGGIDNEFRERERIAPGFRALLTDDVDGDGNTLLRRNIGVRDVLSPTPTVLCGSVIAIVVNGVLSVPFLDGISEEPSFDVDDEPTVAQIGGRFEFIVSVQ